LHALASFLYVMSDMNNTGVTMLSTNRLPARTATAAELERLFTVSAATWRRWGREGRVAMFRIGKRRVLLDLTEAEAMIRNVCVQEPAQ
jgi:hypothetical protein